MPEFVQIMRFRTAGFDTLNQLTEQYRSDTTGRSTYTSEVLGRDLDSGEYVVIVTFPSKEAADINNALPETAAMAEKMGTLTTEGPSFSNIEVIDQPTRPA
jgi:quinol monooxygenase YgiN